MRADGDEVATPPRNDRSSAAFSARRVLLQILVDKTLSEPLWAYTTYRLFISNAYPQPPPESASVSSSTVRPSTPRNADSTSKRTRKDVRVLFPKRGSTTGRSTAEMATTRPRKTPSAEPQASHGGPLFLHEQARMG